MRRLVLLLTATVVLLASRAPGAAEIVSVSRVGGDGPATAGERVEYEVRLGKSYGHPFDPAEVSVEATFVWAGGGMATVPGFWFQDFTASRDDVGRETLAAQGDAHFRVRFRPAGAGRYDVEFRAVDAEGAAGQAGATPLEVEAAAVARPGVVRLGKGPVPGFERDGQPWIPFGSNVCWSGAGGTGDFEHWYDAMEEVGLTWSRLWMTHFNGTALEWKAGEDGGGYVGLGAYNLQAAWRVDRILDLAEERSIALQLVLQQHSQFETGNWSSWAGNPWNVENGGPCTTSMEFFTRPDVVEGFDRKVRYLVARYADSPALMAWELWNEVDLIEGYRSGIVAEWSHERVRRLRALDAYAHLVTTSYAMPAFGDQDWGFEGYDFAQLHNYLAAYRDALPLFAESLRAFGKPVVVGEFGIDVMGQTNLADADATHLVNATLLALLSGYTGGAMSWWWDNYLDPQGLWDEIAGPARALRDLDVQVVGDPLDSVAAAGTPEPEVLAARTLTGALLWLHDPGSEWDRSGDWTAVPFEGVVVDVQGIAAGEGPCRGAFRVASPWGLAGVESGTIAADEDLPGGGTRFTVPSFVRDLLVNVWCEGGDAPDEGGVVEEARADIGGPSEEPDRGEGMTPDGAGEDGIGAEGTGADAGDWEEAVGGEDVGGEEAPGEDDSGVVEDTGPADVRVAETTTDPGRADDADDLSTAGDPSPDDAPLPDAVRHRSRGCSASF